MRHPLIYTAPQRLGPLVQEELFRRLCRSRDYLAAGLDQPVRLADAAREACLSPYHYHRLFARTFGETPHDFLTRLRMDRAKRLLARAFSQSGRVLAVGVSAVAIRGKLI